MKTSLAAFAALVLTAVGFAFHSRAIYAAATGAGTTASSASTAREAESLKLFDQAARVFQHPRCLNCHPGGDQPTQGMDMHVHAMNVQRGPKDHGAVALQCSACHGTANNEASNVPGAPKWALAPKSLAWQGLSKGDLCRKLRGDYPNGKFAEGMSTAEFLHHNGQDALVGWGWHPGNGREAVPFTQKKFGEILSRWIETGAACPE